MNTFGNILRFSSFGESHGQGIGALIDGMPAGLDVDFELLNAMLLKRRPGGRYVSSRMELDIPRILSGLYDGKTTGAPIAVWVENKNYKEADYDEQVLRPSHADYTYFKKYKNVDLSGGGRASARESVARVIAGSFAMMLLACFDIELRAGLCAVGPCECEGEYDFTKADKSQIFALGNEAGFLEQIDLAKRQKDSIGGCVAISAKGLMPGLGEPLYDKLSSKLAHALMGINAVKALEFGAGVRASKMRGSSYNDQMRDGVFLSNNSGGLLGGLSNQNELLIKAHFKPTPSIFCEQESINKAGENIKIKLKGRHDPCVAVRGVVVAQAMCALVLADALLANTTARLEYIKKIF